MEKIKLKIKKILIALIFLPIVVFFPACGNNENNNTNTVDPSATYTVHFYTGTEDTFNINNQTVARGGLVRRPDNPVRVGWIFIGWYKDIELTEVWTFEIDVVTSDLTLYARWQEREY